jgi:hypothetical protein
MRVQVVVNDDIFLKGPHDRDTSHMQSCDLGEIVNKRTPNSIGCSTHRSIDRGFRRRAYGIVCIYFAEATKSGFGLRAYGLKPRMVIVSCPNLNGYDTGTTLYADYVYTCLLGSVHY